MTTPEDRVLEAIPYLAKKLLMVQPAIDTACDWALGDVPEAMRYLEVNRIEATARAMAEVVKAAREAASAYTVREQIDAQNRIKVALTALDTPEEDA